MDLKTFVTQTIDQIIEGVEDSIKNSGDKATIGSSQYTEIEFDVALFDNKPKGITISRSGDVTTRVKFKINVDLPTNDGGEYPFS